MGTEVKLKREAIERRIAELEGKMPDIQASKEGAEARATIRRLKARLKTYPQEPKKRIYKVKARFIFDGVFEIRAHTRKEAVQMAKIGCGMNIGEIHTCWKSHATLTLLATQDLPTFGYNMIDPLKSWCWGSILFYPFKISRFS